MAENWSSFRDDIRAFRKELDAIKNEVGVAEVQLWRAKRSAEVRALVAKFAPGAEMLEEGFDLCVIGLTRISDGYGRTLVRVVYDIDKVVQMFAEDGVGQEDAMKHIEETHLQYSSFTAPVFVLELPVGRS